MALVTILISVLVVLVSLVAAYVLYMSRCYRVFKQLGIPYVKPWPGLGNMPELMKDGFINFHRKMYYDMYRDQKVYGAFEPGKPVMVIKDMDMIRDVCIKNFNSFVNRRPISDEEPFVSMLTMLKDQRWRRVRNIVSPTFSSGKLRHMYPHIERCARVLVDNLKEAHEKDEEVELKKVISCYTMDVIASTGFGVETNSLKDKNNPFVKQASYVLDSSGRLFALIFLVPWLMKILARLGIGLFSRKALKFFFDFVDAAFESRHQEEKMSQKRQDFLQLLIDADQATTPTSESPDVVSDGDAGKDDLGAKKLSKPEIEGQAILFIMASFETTSTAFSFCMYLLAQHPECCKKVQEELDRVLDGRFPTYESVQKLTYLDMCLNEAMRMFPPGFILDRVCNEDCVIQGVKIPKGMTVAFPVICIHNDPAIWDEPEKFDPERFTTANKANRHPFAHMPFGMGPRNCIGMRLALLEMKIALAAVLQETSLVPCAKSVYPVKLEPFRMKAVDDLWVKVVPRK